MNNFVCLLIDDDEDDHAIFRTALNEVAPETDFHSARDGDEAFQVLLNGLTPNCIFLDINMPRMNGIDFLKHIKNNDQLKRIPVVVHSTSEMPCELDIITKLGASGVHCKCYRFKDVCDMIKQYFAQFSNKY